MKAQKHIVEVDVFGSAHGSTGWSTYSVGFAQALSTFTPVSFRAGRRAAIGGLLGSLGGPLFRGVYKAPGDFGVVVLGTPFQGQPSARWNVWETTKLPVRQLELCASTQYLWTPSTWGRSNLIANGFHESRVAVVPGGVDVEFFRPSIRRPGPRFRFLMVGKWENRKFCEGLLRAFTEEFKPQEAVELYLHAHNPYLPGFSLRSKVEEAGFSDVGQVLLGGHGSRVALRELYRSADCFVLPTRAEGWGLPILESMACGVPAIATRYSAQLDYLNDENGYLLNVASLVEAYDEDFNIRTGLWAEPDLSHLRHLMRTAFENQQHLREKGRLARETAEKFTWKHAAEIALKSIRGHLQFGGGSHGDGAQPLT
ncbi:MAG: glycosyltransferase family 4 protein [Gemmatimonadaceae bacterium]